jgi:hypothetical protein
MNLCCLYIFCLLKKYKPVAYFSAYFLLGTIIRVFRYEPYRAENFFLKFFPLFGQKKNIVGWREKVGNCLFKVIRIHRVLVRLCLHD